jgi:hypothetical protein
MAPGELGRIFAGSLGGGQSKWKSRALHVQNSSTLTLPWSFAHLSVEQFRPTFPIALTRIVTHACDASRARNAQRHARRGRAWPFACAFQADYRRDASIKVTAMANAQQAVVVTREKLRELIARLERLQG